MTPVLIESKGKGSILVELKRCNEMERWNGRGREKGEGGEGKEGDARDHEAAKPSFGKAAPSYSRHPVGRTLNVFPLFFRRFSRKLLFLKTSG